MPVISDINIKITPKEITHALYKKRKAPEKIIDSIHEAINKAHDLLQPKVVYEWIAVKGAKRGVVILEAPIKGQEVHLKMGPHGSLMRNTDLALVMCVTVGEALDRHIEGLTQSHRFLDAYLLDVVGVVALGKIGAIMCDYAEKEAESRGWGVGILLGPGSLEGWPLVEQTELCRLLPLEKIDVFINESGVLVPFKSATGIIGIGHGYTSKKVGTVCYLCKFSESCWGKIYQHP